MAWSAILGLVALSATLRVASSAAASTGRAQMQVDQEVLGITDQGGLHHVKAGHEDSKVSSLMRSDTSSMDIGAKGEAAAEHRPEHQAHHGHKEHAHGKHQHRHHHGHHGAAEQEEPPADKGFEAMLTESKHTDREDEQEQDREAQGDRDDDVNERRSAKARESDVNDGEYAEKGVHRVAVDPNGELMEEDSEFLPALGLSNPSDLAYRAMDMMFGIASIIPEDYPFVCICGDTGVCQENLPEGKKTGCPSRIGQKAGAASTPLGIVAVAVAVIAGVRN